MNLTPKTTIRLLGRDWEFVYDFQTIFEWDSMAKKSLVVYPVRSLTTQEWLMLLYAGIHRHDPALKFETFLSGIQAGNPIMAMNEISAACLAVMELIYTEIEGINADAKDESDEYTKDGDGEDPPQASLGTG